MSADFVQRIQMLNYDFYENIGVYFNHTRKYAWEGWEKLAQLQELELLKKSSQELKVLDLGCGNGRFLEFLLDQSFSIGSYTGLDSSDFLLSKAGERQIELGFTYSTFKKTDLWIEDWEKQFEPRSINLITLFGVMHHVPSLEIRQSLLAKVSQLLGKNGLVILTSWRFLDVPRLSRRVVDLQSDRAKEVLQKYGLKVEDFEPGDHLLDWHRGDIAYRFSHYYSDEEMIELINNAGMKVLQSFRADGKEGEVNGYFVCGK